MEKLLDFLAELKERNIFYKLSQIRPDSILVGISVPGERWEVEFFDDGHLEVETFLANPIGIETEEAIQRLFDKFSD